MGMKKLFSLFTISLVIQMIQLGVTPTIFAAELTAEEWLKKANGALGKDNHEQAIEAYSKSIELRPSFGYFNRGGEYSKLGNYQQAIG
jgi:tetratricopeptide (TPR) repeat protein